MFRIDLTNNEITPLKMYKVCIICGKLPPFYGGAEQRAFSLAKRLQTYPSMQILLIGHDEQKGKKEVTSFSEYVFPIRTVINYGGVRNKQIKFLLLIMYLFEVSLRIGWQIIKNNKKIDIVHIINPAYWFNAIAILVAKILHKKVIVETTLKGNDDPISLGNRRDKGQLIKHKPIKLLLFEMADYYVSKSSGLSQTFIKTDIAQNRLFQIPSGVDINRFKPSSEVQKRKLRQLLGLPTDHIIILFVGGFEERKGPDRILKAYKSIINDHLNTTLVLVGPTERFDVNYVSKIHNSINSWDLSKNVIIREGITKNIDEYMQIADIFTLPTRQEGFSMAILEAMASGLAIITSDIPEISGCQINHNVEGLLTQPDNIQDISESLVEMITNPEKRSILGRAARERVLVEFTNQIVDEQYINLYRFVHDCHVQGA